jgi:hypothetical protein
MRQLWEFCAAEGDKPTCIHKHLLKVYPEATVDVNTVQWWVGQIKEAETQEAPLHDKPWNGHTCTAVMPHNILNRLICGNCHITDNLCSTIYINKGSVIAIIKELGSSKVSPHWVPGKGWQMNTKRQGNQQPVMHQYNTEHAGFLSQNVTSDDTCVHYFEPKSKQQSGEECHMTSPRKKKFKCAMLEKSCLRSFEKRKVLSLQISCLHRNSELWTLRSLNAHLHWTSTPRKMPEVMLLHNNGRLHKSVCSTVAINKFWMDMLPHAPWHVAACTLQSWPCPIRLSPVWPFEKVLWRHH